jgi:hypothetical protein
MNNNNEILDADPEDLMEDVDTPDVDVEEDISQDVDAPVRFNVTSYGWDSDVEGLVKRIKRGDIFVPAFQRKFVWKGPEKSRFVESLILGLPVPTIFLAKDSTSGKLNIVDGQQRLITLQLFLDGKFKLSGKGLEADLVGRYFSSEVAPTKKSKFLDEVDRISFENAIIRAIVINPDPAVDDTEFGTKYNKAVIQIFQRLNTSGKPLQAQEVRSCILHGSMNVCLHNMNIVAAWRDMFGPEHGRLKDMEALLRYTALLKDGAAYSSPMPRFLDDFMEKNRGLSEEIRVELIKSFTTAIELVKAAKGDNFFKNGGTFLLSRFDAIMVAVSEWLVINSEVTADVVSARIDDLLNDETHEGYQWAIEEFVNDTNRVTARLTRARHFLRD